MISRHSKTFLTVGAIYLIFWDLALLFTGKTGSGAEIFSTVFSNSLPCRLLIGVTVLLSVNEHKAKKVSANITAAVCGIMAAIRFFALIMQITFIIKGTAVTGTAEYFEIAKFAGEILILVAAIFLMQLLVSGKFSKAVLTFSLSALVIFAAYHVADVVFAVQSMEAAGLSGIGDFLANCLTGGFILSVLGIAAYLISFTVPTGLFEKNKNEDIK